MPYPGGRLSEEAEGSGGEIDRPAGTGKASSGDRLETEKGAVEMRIRCRKCGATGDTGGDAGIFEVRGQFQGKAVRKCRKCGARLCAKPGSVLAAKAGQKS